MNGYENGYDATRLPDGKRTTGWCAIMDRGEVYVVPCKREQGSAHFRPVGTTISHSIFLDDKDVSVTQEEALSRARLSVGMAKLDTPRIQYVQAFKDSLRHQLRCELAEEVKDELREILRPVIEERMMLEAERAALSREKEERPMARAYIKEETEGTTDNPTLLDKAKAAGSKAVTTVKTDAQKAAVRSIARQIVAGAQKALVKFLVDKGVGPKARGPIVELIDSQAGKMVMGYTLGTIVPLIPGLAGRPIIVAAGDELRVEAMSLGLDSVFEGLGEYVFPDVMKSVAALEKATGDEGGFAAAANQSVRDAGFVPTSTS